MTGWTRQTARDIQDDQLGVTARTAPTTPMKLAVCTATGTASSAGTELGSTTRPSITFGGATNADPPVSSNTGAVNVTCGAAGTINGADIYDNAGTPIRKAWASLTTPRTVAIGDILAFAIGAIQVQTAS